MKAFAILLMINTVFNAPINPDENRDIKDPNLFEGDMILTPEQRAYAMMGLDVSAPNKQGAASRGPLWPNGVLIYDISPVLAKIPTAMAAILAGMDEWSRKTCIRFRKRTTEMDYAYFKYGSGSWLLPMGNSSQPASVHKIWKTFTIKSKSCLSPVGKIGSRQDIILEDGCWTRGIVAHEIGHSLGFYHEQSRPDRDLYVSILWDNILPDKKFAFSKYGKFYIDSLGSPYDYRSVMHYEANAFTKNGLPTILVKQPGFQNIIGQRDGLSALDADQAKKLYRCAFPVGVNTMPPPATTGLPITSSNQQN